MAELIEKIVSMTLLLAILAPSLNADALNAHKVLDGNFIEFEFLTCYVQPGGMFAKTPLQPVLLPALEHVAFTQQLQEDGEPQKNLMAVAAHLGLAQWAPDLAGALGQKTQNFKPYVKDAENSGNSMLQLYRRNNMAHKDVGGTKTFDYFGIIAFPGSSNKGLAATQREVAHMITHFADLMPRGLMMEQGHLNYLLDQISGTRGRQALVPARVTSALISLTAAVTAQNTQVARDAVGQKRKTGQVAMSKDYGVTFKGIEEATTNARDVKRQAIQQQRQIKRASKSVASLVAGQSEGDRMKAQWKDAMRELLQKGRELRDELTAGEGVMIMNIDGFAGGLADAAFIGTPVFKLLTKQVGDNILAEDYKAILAKLKADGGLKRFFGQTKWTSCTRRATQPAAPAATVAGPFFTAGMGMGPPSDSSHYVQAAMMAGMMASMQNVMAHQGLQQQGGTMYTPQQHAPYPSSFLPAALVKNSSSSSSGPDAESSSGTMYTPQQD
ncbi:hypothetical protein B484DRAFT_429516 [Ochromonadaceae sp. CCMP2298]|nr:hypothetical protein B484DRAFT_429516 [Ochromonadaceae sp. CCMP2298]